MLMIFPLAHALTARAQGYPLQLSAYWPVLLVLVPAAWWLLGDTALLPATRAWLVEGVAAYYVGYRPVFVLGRCLYRLRTDPAAAGLVVGYLGALLRRAPVLDEPAVRAALRERQRARHGLVLAFGRLRGA